MNDFYKIWLELRGATPGVWLCGISLSNQSCLGRSNDAAFPLERLPQVLRHLSEYTHNLLAQRLPAARLLWTFENARVHWAVRPDKTCLALFTPADPAACDPSLAEELVNEFLQLDPGN